MVDLETHQTIRAVANKLLSHHQLAAKCCHHRLVDRIIPNNRNKSRGNRLQRQRSRQLSEWGLLSNFEKHNYRMTNQTVDALLYLLNKHYRSPTPTAIVVRAWESQQSTLSAAVQHDFQHSHPHPHCLLSVTLATLTNCYYYYTFDWAPSERVSRSCGPSV